MSSSDVFVKFPNVGQENQYITALDSKNIKGEETDNALAHRSKIIFIWGYTHWFGIMNLIIRMIE